ncbi:CHD5-like protein-domain-containing protein, partial [Kalaharituber pfeilii]
LFPSQVSSQIREQRDLRLELLRLKKEIRGTSAQDQFAKWAKAKRKHDEKLARLEVLNSTITSTRLKFTSKTRVLRFLLTTGTRMAVQIYYIKQPVFYVPAGWVPGYFELLLAFPRAPRGSVSVQTWGLACSSVVDVLVGKILVGWGGKQVGELAESRRKKVKVGEGERDGEKE